MGLFTQVIKKGAKVVDGLLDDAADAGQKVDKVDWEARYAEARRLDAENWDEAAWVAENPPAVNGWPNRPLKDFSEEERKIYDRWRNRKSAAATKNVRKLDRERRGSDPDVRARNNERARERHHRLKDDPDQIRKKREQYERAKEYRRAKARQHYADNRERQIELTREYRKKNREQILEKNRARYMANPEPAKAAAEKRRAARIQRTVPWSDDEKMNEIYRASREISEITGVPHDVDHVMPMQGRGVSGLHHQDNLLIVPRSVNASKSNKFEPGDLPPRAGIRNARALLKKIKKEHGLLGVE